MKRNVIIALVVFFIVIGIAIATFVQSKLKDSDAYKSSLEFVESNQDIANLIGPIQGYGIIKGTVEYDKFSGQAALEYNIEGERGEVNIHVELDKDSTGNWKVVYHRLYD